MLSPLLSCLLLIARHHGLDLSVDRMVHDHALSKEPDTPLFLRIAREQGLKAAAVRINWDHLSGLGEALPAILRLNDQRSVILSGLRVRPDGCDAVIIDPGSGTLEFQFLSRAELEAQWDGQAILLKRMYRLTDADQPFGLRWFIPEILRQKFLFRDVILAVLVLHVLALAVPIFFQLVIDRVLVHQAYSTLTVLGVGVALALLFDSLLTYLRSYLLLHASAKIDIRVATRTFGHLLSLPVPFFQRMAAGVLTKHMQQAGTIREFLTGRLFSTVLDASALIIFVPILFFYSVSLTLLVLAVTALLGCIMLLLMGPFRRRLHALYAAEGGRQSLLVESIHGIDTLKTLALEPTSRQQWGQRAADVVERHIEVGRIAVLARAISQLLEKLMIVAVVWVGAEAVFAGSLSVGELVAFQMLAGRVSGPLVQLITLVQDYQEASLSVRMLGEIMNRPAEAGTQRGLRPPLNGTLSLEDVTFKYPGADLPALDRLNLTVPAGKTLGIVGRSGSGKTTLTRLLQGVYQAQGGLIRIDGYDLRELDLTHLRQRIGVVLQDTFLFRGTIRENLAVANPSARFEDIVEVARIATADEFIQHLPQGYDTQLEEGATNLSGGQRQRLAIARALLRDPTILILDEATSALDPESEGLVQRNLARITAQRTTLIVSHRLSMLRRADAILVLDGGRKVGFGTHDQLLRECEVYSTLWRQQIAGFGP